MHFSWKKNVYQGWRDRRSFQGHISHTEKFRPEFFRSSLVVARCCSTPRLNIWLCLIPYIEKIRTAVNIFLDDHNLLVLMKKNQRLFISNCIIHCVISFTKYSHTVSPVIRITVRNNTSLKPRNVFPAGCPSNALRMTLSHEIQLQS